MDNECHANICVFVQNSPDPPPPLLTITNAYTVRPLLSAVLGRTIFWSQKPRIIIEVRG